ncbi:unnamed protein product, partial [Ectocarpus sp. 8 AP-2014]
GQRVRGTSGVSHGVGRTALRRARYPRHGGEGQDKSCPQQWWRSDGRDGAGRHGRVPSRLRAR